MNNPENMLEYLSGTLGGVVQLDATGDEQRLISVNAPQDSPPVLMGVQMWGQVTSVSTALSDSSPQLSLRWGTGQGVCEAQVDVVSGGMLVVSANSLTVDAVYAEGRIGALAAGGRRVSASVMAQAPAAGAYPAPTLTGPRWNLAVGGVSNLARIPGFARRATILHNSVNPGAAIPAQPVLEQYVAAGSIIAVTEAVRGQMIPLLGQTEEVRMRNAVGPAGNTTHWLVWEIAL